MGVDYSSNMLTLRGKADKVDRITCQDISRLSKYSIGSYQLRFANEDELIIGHSTLNKSFFYPETQTIELVTEDDYRICLTKDVKVFTLDGWKEAEDVKVGDLIYTNGIDIPPYQDKETLRKLYYDEHLTQREIAERLGCKERTVRFWIHRHDLEKGVVAKQIGEKNGRWKGDDITTHGGYERTHEKFNKLKKGVCSRCGRTLPTQLHHLNRDTTNLSEDNLIELCDLCHAMEHHGYVIQWVRPARVTKINYGGSMKTYGAKLFDSDNIIINGFILRFDENNAEVKEFEKDWKADLRGD